MTDVENVIRAFSAYHVVRLTGLSLSQLRYWDKTGFFRPRYASENRRSPYSRVYSFKNIVGLRTLGVLRKLHKISLQHLRKVAQELSQYKDTPWSEITIFVLGEEVYFREPETETLRGIISKQYTKLPLRSIIRDVTAEANKLKERSKEQFGHVERHRYIVHNAWVIAGTRIPTKAIWRFRAAGYSTDNIIREYPALTEKDVEVALEHEKTLAKRA